jgi:2-amino-4-hydroxy-6-hydroxymethyldihydropteridine diphosphokinase
MHKAYLLTGTNLGERKENLEKAKTMIENKIGKIKNSSAIYETAAWGLTDQPSFFNQALEIETALNARQLIRRILKIERSMGRIRQEKYGPRLIDIDILLFNDEKHNYPLLKLPHPELQNRRFALVPLASIAGEAIHPVFNKTIDQLLQECNDPLPVQQVS